MKFVLFLCASRVNHHKKWTPHALQIPIQRSILVVDRLNFERDNLILCLILILSKKHE
ncbi:hypothetical protein Peur_054863 [Populus x canadensis]